MAQSAPVLFISQPFWQAMHKRDFLLLVFMVTMFRILRTIRFLLTLQKRFCVGHVQHWL